MARHLKRAANIGLTAVSIEGGLISPDQVAAIASFLTREEAANITGANLSVDGGWTAA